MSQFLANRADIDMAAGTALLRGDEAHHLARVTRARPGETVRIFDGAGSRWQCTLAHHDRDTSALCNLAPLPSNEPKYPLILAAGLIKGERWEWLLEKAVELGATGILPLACARSQIGPEEAAKKIARWEKIILAAAKQCERGRIPALGEPKTVESFAASLPPKTTDESRWAFFERTDAGFPHPSEGSALAATGPEGGFNESETRALTDAGFNPATLGLRILRAETAAAAALILMGSLRKIG